ncbi:MAG TPA: hypothetical protein VJH24_05645 [Candidatus Bilamarchaeaceae archaeon]|nr:hypothetical protein [Candidatus Bilamarchaeaceae archaeon]
MSKTVLRVVLGLLAIGLGIGMTMLWKELRPFDTQNIIIGVGILTALAAFVAMFFMTKAGGSGD